MSTAAVITLCLQNKNTKPVSETRCNSSGVIRGSLRHGNTDDGGVVVLYLGPLYVSGELHGGHNVSHMQSPAAQQECMYVLDAQLVPTGCSVMPLASG